MSKTAGGSASRWGPLFGAQAVAWAETEPEIHGDRWRQVGC
jgi:hypothetical protein